MSEKKTDKSSNVGHSKNAIIAMIAVVIVIIFAVSIAVVAFSRDESADDSGKSSDVDAVSVEADLEDDSNATLTMIDKLGGDLGDTETELEAKKSLAEILDNEDYDKAVRQHAIDTLADQCSFSDDISCLEDLLSEYDGSDLDMSLINSLIEGLSIDSSSIPTAPPDQEVE